MHVNLLWSHCWLMFSLWSTANQYPFHRLSCWSRYHLFYTCAFGVFALGTKPCICLYWTSFWFSSVFQQGPTEYYYGAFYGVRASFYSLIFDKHVDKNWAEAELWVLNLSCPTSWWGVIDKCTLCTWSDQFWIHLMYIILSSTLLNCPGDLSWMF